MTTEEQIIAVNTLRLWGQGFSIAGAATAVLAGALAFYAMARGNDLTAIDKREKAAAAAKRDALNEDEKAALRAEVVGLKGQLTDVTFQRVLTNAQGAQLLEALTALLKEYELEWSKRPESPAFPPTIFIAHEDDEETRLYTKQLSEVISASGWTVNPRGRRDKLPPKLADFEVTYPGGDFTDRMTDRLKAALEHAGLKVALRRNQYLYDHSLDILVRRRDSRNAPTPPIDPASPLTTFAARD
jgi:hypothetical protein